MFCPSEVLMEINCRRQAGKKSDFEERRNRKAIYRDRGEISREEGEDFRSYRGYRRRREGVPRSISGTR